MPQKSLILGYMKGKQDLSEEAAVVAWRETHTGDEWKNVDGIHLRNAYKEARRVARRAGHEGRGRRDKAKSSG